MQVLLLGLFVALYLHDATTAVQQRVGADLRVVEALPGDVWPGLGIGWVTLIVFVPKLLVALLYYAACERTRRRLGTSRGQRALNLLEAMTAALPLVLLGLFIVDLSAGALRTVRLALQHTVLVDEVIVMLPTLLVAVWAWWAYYPVDRRLREALLFREADSGKPIYPLLSRGGYVLMQLRHQFGLLLLPLLAVFGWAEALVLLGPDHGGPLSTNTVLMLTPVGIVVVFIFAPLVIRYAWHTAPLANGEVRDRMLSLCKQHKVRVRELLVWRTSGRMVNAAVTGLFRQVRYILLSDGLLDQVEPREVEAVMAHELAHVKLRHLVWMGLVVIAALGTLEEAGHYALDTWAGPMQSSPTPADGSPTTAAFDLNDPNVRMMIVSVPAFTFGLFAFGWVSRRIERQADVFAARHLALSAQDKQFDRLGRQVFDTSAVGTMVHALQRISELNHAPTHRPSWRHGSIAWRQEHLNSLIGQPLDHTPVDRVLIRVKIVTLVGLVALVLAYTQ